MRDALAEAVRLYGEPAIPVREIHIRQSRSRRNPELLSRADVTDWPRLIALLREASDGSAHLRPLWSVLSPAARQSLASAAETGAGEGESARILLVQDLNRWIGSNGGRRERLSSLLPGCFPPPAGNRPVARGIELCELLDRAEGRFVLYVKSGPGDPAFPLELAHEAGHLLNAEIYDWYMEGLCNHLAERVARRKALPWEPWESLFARNRGREAYATAYALFRDLSTAAGPEAMRSFLRHLRPGPQGHSAIDIDAWLSALPPAPRAAALAALREDGPALRRLKGDTNAFALPRELETGFK